MQLFVFRVIVNNVYVLCGNPVELNIFRAIDKSESDSQMYNPKTRSMIWNVFKKTASDLATCTICMRTLSIRGGSTTNLIRHMKLKHRLVYLQEVQNKKIRLEDALNVKRDEPNLEPTTTTEIEEQNVVDSLIEDNTVIQFKEEDDIWGEEAEVQVDLISQPPPPKKPRNATPQQENTNSYSEATNRELDTQAKINRCKLYADYIASKLETYSDYVFNMVQHNFAEILFKADMGQYNSQSNETN